MTRILNSNDIAISIAKQNGTLRIERCFNSRLGNEYWAISDDRGLIEVALSEEEANKIVG